jgi:hypothetical protein
MFKDLLGQCRKRCLEDDLIMFTETLPSSMREVLWGNLAISKSIMQIYLAALRKGATADVSKLKVLALRAESARPKCTHCMNIAHLESKC